MEANTPEPKWFVWSADNHRAEFSDLSAALDWAYAHYEPGLTLTRSADCSGVAGASWECDECGCRHLAARDCCHCQGDLYTEDNDGGAHHCTCPAAVAKSDADCAYWEGELRGVPARDVFSERALAERGLSGDEVAVPSVGSLFAADLCGSSCGEE